MSFVESIKNRENLVKSVTFEDSSYFLLEKRIKSYEKLGWRLTHRGRKLVNKLEGKRYKYFAEMKRLVEK